MSTKSGGKYAAGTSVAVGKSRDEIERTLRRYGADGFAYAQNREGAVVAFTIHDRHVRFYLPLPGPADDEFWRTPTNLRRSATSANNAWEQAIRARWRALGLIIKAKLEAVEAGIVGFDVEFMPHLVLPDQRTVGEAVAGQLTAAIEGGPVPALMPGGPR